MHLGCLAGGAFLAHLLHTADGVVSMVGSHTGASEAAVYNASVK